MTQYLKLPRRGFQKCDKLDKNLLKKDGQTREVLIELQKKPESQVRLNACQSSYTVDFDDLNLQIPTVNNSICSNSMVFNINLRITIFMINLQVCKYLQLCPHCGHN
ncbi:hypothetical protein [Flavobacterium notoginsengisoli]|uniref:hypothetical protein n=1 Tax=Flavobacterium notoginsengisoli TaxID=1478199 RepID=UPI0036314956